MFLLMLADRNTSTIPRLLPIVVAGALAVSGCYHPQRNVDSERAVVEEVPSAPAEPRLQKSTREDWGILGGVAEMVYFAMAIGLGIAVLGYTLADYTLFGWK